MLPIAAFPPVTHGAGEPRQSLISESLATTIHENDHFCDRFIHLAPQRSSLGNSGNDHWPGPLGDLRSCRLEAFVSAPRARARHVSIHDVGTPEYGVGPDQRREPPRAKDGS